jgi:ABC-type polysaccharide/polyol phosphate export permease
VILVFQVLLVLGLGFALCSVNVYYRDVHLFVNVATTLGFYVTPIIYRTEAVAESFPLVLQLNPMAHFMTMYRAILLPPGQLPDWGSAAVLFMVCTVIFGVGYWIYRIASPTFVDEL